jgi:hypothetical protein
MVFRESISKTVGHSGKYVLVLNLYASLSARAIIFCKQPVDRLGVGGGLREAIAVSADRVRLQTQGHAGRAERGGDRRGQVRRAATLQSHAHVDHFLQMCPEQNVVFDEPTCALTCQQTRYRRSLQSMYVSSYCCLSSLIHTCPHTHEARGFRTYNDVTDCTVTELSGHDMDSWDAR